jgi:hypothetical protein
MTESIDPEAFDGLIAARVAGAAVPTDEIALEVSNTSLRVRLAGAAITECVIDDAPVLVSPMQESQLPDPGLLASYAVAPFSSERTSAQTDPFKWADFTLVGRIKPPNGTTDKVKLAAQTPVGHPGLTRIFGLTRLGARITTTLSNPSDATTPLAAGIGEHLNVVLGGGDTRIMDASAVVSNLKTNQPASEATEPDAEGDYWNTFASATIGYPREVPVSIMSHMTNSGIHHDVTEVARRSLGIIMGRVPEAIGWISIEALVGARKKEGKGFVYDMLLIPPGMSVSLHTDLFTERLPLKVVS